MVALLNVIGDAGPPRGGRGTSRGDGAVRRPRRRPGLALAGGIGKRSGDGGVFGHAPFTG